VVWAEISTLSCAALTWFAMMTPLTNGPEPVLEVPSAHFVSAVAGTAAAIARPIPAARWLSLFRLQRDISTSFVPLVGLMAAVPPSPALPWRGQADWLRQAAAGASPPGHVCAGSKWRRRQELR